MEKKQIAAWTAPTTTYPEYLNFSIDGDHALIVLREEPFQGLNGNTASVRVPLADFVAMCSTFLQARAAVAEPSWQTKADDARAALVVMADNAAEAEKVDRVARALAENDPVYRGRIFEYFSPQVQEVFRSDARAALAAAGGE